MISRLLTKTPTFKRLLTFKRVSDCDPILKGIRCQLYLTLLALNKGHKVYIFGQLAIEIHLEGSWAIATLLPLLIKEKLVEETPEEHWIAPLTLQITDRGRKIYADSQAWWDSLTTRQKILMFVTE